MCVCVLYIGVVCIIIIIIRTFIFPCLLGTNFVLLQNIKKKKKNVFDNKTRSKISVNKRFRDDDHKNYIIYIYLYVSYTIHILL